MFDRRMDDFSKLPASAKKALEQRRLGAQPGRDGTAFTVIAPEARFVRLHLEGAGRARDLPKLAEGVFGGSVAQAVPGTRYRLEPDGHPPLPDPASRWQPLGVHGPSEVVDARSSLGDRSWQGAPEALRLYELHVGTFTREGTFRAAIERLPALAALGVNAVELMPVADFPGNRNWGYDPAALFAPARCYGTPGHLRELVSAAHEQGLAVLLDVIYNHLGPDGAYAPAFIPSFFSPDRHGPWGRAVNLDGPGSAWVRHFLLENARYWLHEFRLDGLRLDATHAMFDEGSRHFLEQLASTVREDAAREGRRVVVIAEDDRNLDTVVRPRDRGGWGLDAVWADDFHHQIRSAIAGDQEGYYGDYTGTTADIAATVRGGWFYTGQHSRHAGKPRGTDASGVEPARFVYCVQNHDQIGNRAMGERLHHEVDIPAYLAASLLLLVLPQTPLLFMGQEWAASTRFLFFTDHNEPLGRLVTEGRRREFSGFSAFVDPAVRLRIPDPQAASTFEASRLCWDEVAREPHAGVRRFYEALLALRARHPLLSPSAAMRVEAVDDDTVCVVRHAPGSAARLAAVVRLRGKGTVVLPDRDGDSDWVWDWDAVLQTEEPAYQADARGIEVIEAAQGNGRDPAAGRGGAESSRRVRVRFPRPGGIILAARARPTSSGR